MIAVGIGSITAIVIIWVGYPLVVRLLATAPRSHPLAGSGALPCVSVVLATRADADAVRDRVGNLLAMEYPPHLVEIVVALDGEVAPDEFTELPDRVRIVSSDAPGGKASALNAGVRASHGEVLVFADTAQRFASDAIAELVRELDDPQVGAVSGMLDRAEGRSATMADRYWRYERWLRFWEARLHSTVGVTGAIYAMRRSLWQPLPAGVILDDLYLPMRLGLAGWRVGYTDRARAIDVRQFDVRQEFHRKVRTLTGVVQVCAWLPAVLVPWKNPLWLQFVFHKLLRLLTPYLGALAVVSFGGAVAMSLIANPARGQLLVAAAAVATVAALVPGVRRTLKTQIAWGLALQASAAVATVNGLRGRWDVWR